MLTTQYINRLLGVDPLPVQEKQKPKKENVKPLILKAIGEGYNTTADIAAYAGVSITTVRTSIIELEESGELRRTKRGQRGRMPKYDYEVLSNG